MLCKTKKAKKNFYQIFVSQKTCKLMKTLLMFLLQALQLGCRHFILSLVSIKDYDRQNIFKAQWENFKNLLVINIVRLSQTCHKT